jgi:hypothetical protein
MGLLVSLSNKGIATSNHQCSDIFSSSFTNLELGAVYDGDESSVAMIDGPGQTAARVNFISTILFRRFKLSNNFRNLSFILASDLTNLLLLKVLYYKSRFMGY